MGAVNDADECCETESNIKVADKKTKQKQNKKVLNCSIEYS